MSDESIQETLQRILDRLPPPAPDSPPCPDRTEGEHCDGQGHYDGDPNNRPRPSFVRRCPILVRQQIAERIGEEKERLWGLLQQCRGTFESFDPMRGFNTRTAHNAALEFGGAGPPTWNFLLAGKLGLGKTHLLLSSHFALLESGVRSYFVGSTDLRELFKTVNSHDADERKEAERQRDRLLSAQVIHWDDAGDVDGDQRWKGTFAEGIKFLLDRSRAVWAVSINLTYDQAVKHPDLGPKVMSRLLRKGGIDRLWWFG